jgi:hypothetical protein
MWSARWNASRADLSAAGPPASCAVVTENCGEHRAEAPEVCEVALEIIDLRISWQTGT